MAVWPHLPPPPYPNNTTSASIGISRDANDAAAPPRAAALSLRPSTARDGGRNGTVASTIRDGC